MLLPTYCELGAAVLKRTKSACTLMVLAIEAASFEEFKSVVAAVTLAELVIVPTTVGVAVMVTVAVALLVRVPRLHVTTLLVWVNVPCEDVAETNVTPAGSGSVSTTLLEDEGPRLVTRRV